MKWLSKLLARLNIARKKKSGELTLREREEECKRHDEQTQKDIEKAIEQAQVWRNRAMMARQQRNDDLEQQALDRMWQYQVLTSKLRGVEPPPGPPLAGNPLGDWGMGDSPPSDPDNPRRPYDPSRVPRKPLPFSGGTEVALPLPNQEDSD